MKLRFGGLKMHIDNGRCSDIKYVAMWSFCTTPGNHLFLLAIEFQHEQCSYPRPDDVISVKHLTTHADPCVLFSVASYGRLTLDHIRSLTNRQSTIIIHH